MTVPASATENRIWVSEEQIAFVEDLIEDDGLLWAACDQDVARFLDCFGIGWRYASVNGARMFAPSRRANFTDWNQYLAKYNGNASVTAPLFWIDCEPKRIISINDTLRGAPDVPAIVLAAAFQMRTAHFFYRVLSCDNELLLFLGLSNWYAKSMLSGEPRGLSNRPKVSRVAVVGLAPGATIVCQDEDVPQAVIEVIRNCACKDGLHEGKRAVGEDVYEFRARRAGAVLQVALRKAAA